MKILILGTSNSILKGGWVLGLKTALPDAEITNLSVGASPGTQFGLNMTDDLSCYDAVFFDSVVNDENLRPFVGADAIAHRVFYEIISTISAQAPAIVMGFSNARFLHQHSDAYTRRRELAAICGAQFVGIHELVELFGKRLLPAGQRLFDAPGTHPNEAVQCYFGYLLGRLLKLARGNMAPGPRAVNFARNFTAVTAQDLAGQGKIVTRSSSIMSRDFLELPAGAVVHFSAPGACLGFTVDANTTRAFAVLSGPATRRVKEFWFDTNAAKLAVRFVPVRGGLPMNRLRVVKPHEMPATLNGIERSAHSTHAKTAGERDIMFSLANALFWAGTPGDPIPARTAPVDSHLILHSVLRAHIEAAVKDRRFTLPPLPQPQPQSRVMA